MYQILKVFKTKPIKEGVLIGQPCNNKSIFNVCRIANDINQNKDVFYCVKKLGEVNDSSN